MLDFNETTAPFLITGIMAVLLLLGVLLRKQIPFFRKSLLPASIIAGIIGFILINLGVIPIPQRVFETISFHLLNLGFLSITLATTKKVVRSETEQKSEKNVRGGLWLALVWGALISIQIVFAGLLSLVFEKTAWSDFNPLYGMLAAHGFAQGPVQALAMAKTWINSVGGQALLDAPQIGLFFAMVGYLSAVLIGVPICNYFFKKKLTALPKSEFDTELENGVYRKETSQLLGNQTTHRASVDTLTFQWAFMLGIYFLTYLLVSLIDPKHETMVYSMMFAWVVLIGNLAVFVMRKLKADHLIDPGVQTSITNFCTDAALVACMMSVTVGVILKYLVPLISISIGIIGITIWLTWSLAKRTNHYVAERFIAVYGIATGTAITGLLLLRILDPQGETPVTREIVWWNVFQMLTAIVVGSLAPFAAIWGWKSWMAINAGLAAVLLLATILVGKNIALPAVKRTKSIKQVNS